MAITRFADYASPDDLPPGVAESLHAALESHSIYIEDWADRDYEPDELEAIVQNQRAAFAWLNGDDAPPPANPDDGNPTRYAYRRTHGKAAERSREERRYAAARRERERLARVRY